MQFSFGVLPNSSRKPAFTSPFKLVSKTVSGWSHTATAPALYPRPSLSNRLASRLSDSANLGSRLKKLNANRTWNATFGAHTRVGGYDSLLKDLPNVPNVPLATTMAESGKQMPEKTLAREALTTNRLQRTMASARNDSLAGLFAPKTPIADSAPVAPAGRSLLEMLDLAASLFPGASDAQFCRLQQALYALELPMHADRASLAYALAAAAGGDIVRAQQVLVRLTQGLDLNEQSSSASDSASNWGATAVELNADISSQATKLAGLLSRSDDGFTILGCMHPSHAGFGRAAKVLLQSGMHEARHDPHSLAARAHGAARRLQMPGAILTNPEKAAIFAWEQGFRCDDKGSPLQATKRELARFVNKTIPRVNASRFKTFVPRLCGRKKSPLVALGQGMQGANRPTLATERGKVQCAMQATVGHLLANVMQDPAAILRERDPVGALASIATLRYWAARPSAYPGQRIAMNDCAALARDMFCIIDGIDVRQRCRYPKEFASLKDAAKAFRDTPDEAFSNRPAMRRLMRLPLTAKRLAAWGKLRKVPDDQPFWKHLNELKAAMQPRDFKPLKRRHLSTQHSLEKLIVEMQSSSRLRLTDGARRGISTRGLSCNLSRILNFSGIPLGPRLNLGREKRRRAVVEIARSSHGSEILLGTERCRRTTVGAGMMVGYDFKLGPPEARLAVSLDLERTKKKSAFAGVALRVAQRKKSDGTPDNDRRIRGMRNIMDFMFSEQCKNTSSVDDAEQMFERFAVTFFDNPDISLSWSGGCSKSTTHCASAVAAGLLKLEGTPLKIGPGIGVTAERTRAKGSSHGNQNGRMQSAASHRSKTTAVELTLGIKGKISPETPGDPDSAVAVSVLNASLPAWTVPIYTRGIAGKTLLVRENGRLIPTACTLDLEFSRASDYVECLNAERSDWIAQLATKHVGKPDAVQLANQQFDQFLETAHHHARRNQRYVQRMHLRPEVASEIDRHCATAALIAENEHLSSQERERFCAAREAACLELVARPSAWVPQELKILERSAECTRLGLLIGLQIATETSAAGEHQLASLRV